MGLGAWSLEFNAASLIVRISETEGIWRQTNQHRHPVPGRPFFIRYYLNDVYNAISSFGVIMLP